MNETFLQTLEIFKAMLTPMIALIAVYIAVQQYNLAKQKQDIDIYDRRLRIYNKTIQFLRKIERSGNIESDDYHDWECMTFESEFLFDEVVNSHLEKINKIAAILLNINDRMLEDGEERNLKGKSLIQLHAEVYGDLISLVGMTVRVFSPYFQIIKKRHKVSRNMDYQQYIESERKELDKILASIRAEEDDVPF